MFNFKIIRKLTNLPFACFSAMVVKKDNNMLQIKLKRLMGIFVLSLVVSLVLFATDSHAQAFESLTGAGSTIFEGMREIIYAVAGFGVVAIAVGGFFGNLNWKWLSAIIIGLMVIATTAAVINYMVGSSGPTFQGITDTLKTGDDNKR